MKYFLFYSFPWGGKQLKTVFRHWQKSFTRYGTWHITNFSSVSDYAIMKKHSVVWRAGMLSNHEKKHSMVWNLLLKSSKIQIRITVCASEIPPEYHKVQCQGRTFPNKLASCDWKPTLFPCTVIVCIFTKILEHDRHKCELYSDIYNKTVRAAFQSITNPWAHWNITHNWKSLILWGTITHLGSLYSSGVNVSNRVHVMPPEHV